MSVKKSVLELHIQSKKHTNEKERLLRKEKKEVDIVVALKKYDARVHPSGETMSNALRIYRVKVVTAFLQVYLSVNLMRSENCSKRMVSLCLIHPTCGC